MNGNSNRVTRRVGVGIAGIAAAVAFTGSALSISGCNNGGAGVGGGGVAGSGGTFATVNGQAISTADYIKALERYPVNVGQQTQNARQVSAGRMVLEQMVLRTVIASEAKKEGVLPTEDEITKNLEFNKRLYAQQAPDKKYEDFLKEQGTTEDEVKDNLRYNLTETNLIAKRLNLTEAEIKAAYDKAKAGMSIPERASMRFIMLPSGSKDLGQAQKLLAAKTDFTEVAKQYNAPQLKMTGGQISQSPMPLSGQGGLPPAWADKLKQTSDGGYFGPVDMPSTPGQPTMKAWVKIEKKYPGFTVPFEDAKFWVKQQVIKEKMNDPKNFAIRSEMLKGGLNAKFESSDPKYTAMWKAVQDEAKKAEEFVNGGGGGGAPTNGDLPSGISTLPVPGSPAAPK